MIYILQTRTLLSFLFFFFCFLIFGVGEMHVKEDETKQDND